MKAHRAAPAAAATGGACSQPPRARRCGARLMRDREALLDQCNEPLLALARRLGHRDHASFRGAPARIAGNPRDRGDVHDRSGATLAHAVRRLATGHEGAGEIHLDLLPEEADAGVETGRSLPTPAELTSPVKGPNSASQRAIARPTPSLSVTSSGSKRSRVSWSPSVCRAWSRLRGSRSATTTRHPSSRAARAGKPDP